MTKEEFIETVKSMIDNMNAPENGSLRTCLFCESSDQPGIVGVTDFRNTMAQMVGASPGRARLMCHWTCLSCAAKFPTEEAYRAACERQLVLLSSTGSPVQ